MYDVFFQLAGLLEVFQKYHIMHNDLHVQNIIVEKLARCQNITISLDNYKYVRCVTYRIRIIDFDHAMWERNIINTYMNTYVCKKTILPCNIKQTTTNSKPTTIVDEDEELDITLSDLDEMDELN